MSVTNDELRKLHEEHTGVKYEEPTKLTIFLYITRMIIKTMSKLTLAIVLFTFIACFCGGVVYCTLYTLQYLFNLII